MAKKSGPKRHQVWEINVINDQGDTDRPSVTVGKGDTIQWNPPHDEFTVEIKFVDKSPLLFWEKHPKGRKGKPLKRNIRSLFIDPDTFKYGTPDRARKRAGDPEIIVTGGLRPGVKKAGKKKAGKKR